MADQTLIRVLVVDDHTLFRRGVRALLEADMRFEVVAEAGDAGDAYRHAAETQPDVILLNNIYLELRVWMRYPGFRKRRRKPA
jgi:two-component system nitrate/nitrite response regulator NarL